MLSFRKVGSTIAFSIWVNFLATTSAIAQTDNCAEMDIDACLTSTICMLSLSDPMGGYECSAPSNACQIGFAQEFLDHSQEVVSEGSSNLSKMQCEAQVGCIYVQAGPCYCPPGYSCICGGGRTPDCQPASGALLTPPTGVFTIVDARVASGVAAPPANPRIAIGQSVEFTSNGIRSEGISCDHWAVRETYKPISITDPLLADVMIAPMHETNRDARLLRGWKYTCEGELFLELLQVDERVLVLPWQNGTLHLIAEKTLEPVGIARLQDVLRRTGYLKVGLPGQLDKTTLEAIGSVVEERANSDFSYRFARPIITQNLIEIIDPGAEK